MAGAGLLLLSASFGLKAALVPLHTWLVPAYGAALAPVAALFAIMTKVGVYALLRLFVLLPGGGADSGAALAVLPLQMVIAPAALLTVAVAALGAAVAAKLRVMTAYLVLVSVGTFSPSPGCHRSAVSSARPWCFKPSTAQARQHPALVPTGY